MVGTTRFELATSPTPIDTAEVDRGYAQTALVAASQAVDHT
jgi:hypothetical protein